ncbi:MAG TPA: metal ABC transporter permease [Nitrolancea sp.]|nr:metal ABC transporter permease [Nitrolancea sp.]
MLSYGFLSVLASISTFSPNLVQDAREMLSFDFMRNAFLAGSVLSIAAGLVGYFVVARRLIFTSDVLSDVAFPGALIAIILGVSPLIGVFGLVLAAGLGMSVLGGRSRTNDVTTGTLLAWVLGMGVLFLSIYTSGSSASNSSAGVNVLFGSLFGIHARESRVVAIIGIFVVIALLAIARPLLFASLDPQVAAARGVPVRLLNLFFLILLAITAAEAVQAVGALLMFSMLVTPAAIARRLVIRPFVALLLSSALSLVFTWAGITIAFYLPYPVSFCLTALVFASYVGVVVVQRVRHGRTYRRSTERVGAAA